MASASLTFNGVSVSWSCKGQVNPTGTRRGKGIHVSSATSRPRILRTGEAITGTDDRAITAAPSTPACQVPSSETATPAKRAPTDRAPQDSSR